MFQGTGQIDRNRNRVLVVSTSKPPRAFANTVFARTPLDMIATLELHGDCVSKLVLTGRFANHEIAGFLAETYPWLTVSWRRPAESETSLPACA